MRVLRTWQCEFPRELEAIKRRLSPLESLLGRSEGMDTVCRAFGQELSPLESVRRILADVKERGDEALLFYTSAFDGVSLSAEGLKVTEKEIDWAYSKVSPCLLDALRKARENIIAFQKHIKPQAPKDLKGNGMCLRLIYKPIEKVGIYVPGGRASYPSTVLMCTVPARVAGVDRIIMTTPPGPGGEVAPERLVAAREAGVDEVYRLGGVQAIGAMAFGTKTVPRVDKIVGPGNAFVTLAKKEVFGYVDIDMLAGPSEVVIVADETAPPALIASDLLCQAEHPGSAILLTHSEGVAEEVLSELEEQLKGLPDRRLAEESLSSHGLLIITKDVEEAVEIANILAPEHVELFLRDAEAHLGRLRHVGSIFIGDSTPVALGDYIAGPSHVLPTGGTARFFSGLTVNDFLRCFSVISYTRQALGEVASEVVTMAEAEGLPAHARSVRMRFK